MSTITERFNNISDIHGVFNTLNKTISNPLIELNRIINENDITTLELYESTWINTVKPFNDDYVLRKQKKETGKAIRKVCESVLDLIAGYNIESNLTAEQVTELENTFSTIAMYLRANRPFSAKPLIEAIVPDETLVTTEMKTAILKELEL